jgi:hypothetical protein
MGTKHPISPNSSHLIKPCSSHCSFASSCTTTDLSSTSSPLRTTNHPLVTSLILTNHTPPTSAPCQPPTLHVNVRSQPYTFLNPFDHAPLRHFPPPTLLVLIVDYDHTSQPTPIFSTCFQPPPKVLCPTCGRYFTNQRLTCHQCSCQTFNSSNLNPFDHFNPIPSLTPTPPTLTWTWVSTLDVLGSFHLSLCHPCLYNRIPTTLQHDVQMTFRFPLDKLVQDSYNVVAWHLFFLLPQWCFVLPPHGGATGHKETHILPKCFIAID